MLIALAAKVAFVAAALQVAAGWATGSLSDHQALLAVALAATAAATEQSPWPPLYVAAAFVAARQAGLVDVAAVVVSPAEFVAVAIAAVIVGLGLARFPHLGAPVLLVVSAWAINDALSTLATTNQTIHQLTERMPL